MLHDIGNITGIFVTKVGYQSGAEKFANYYGINLRLIREPISEDWTERVKEVRINLKYICVENVDVSWVFDGDWIMQNFSEGLSLDVNETNENVFIINDKGDDIKSLYDIENDLSREIEGSCVHEVDCFDKYLMVDNKKIKLSSLVFRYDVIVHHKAIKHDAEQITKTILKDIYSGEIKFITIDGQII